VMGARTVTLTTIVASFTRTSPAPTYHALLVYTVADSDVDGGEGRLVTAFPVTASFADRLFDPGAMGDAVPVRARSHAFVPGVTAGSAPLTGLRRRAEPP